MEMDSVYEAAFVNPLMVRDAGEGAVAVDALVVLRPDPPEIMA